MNKFKKHIWLVLLVISLLTPVGILLPKYFNARDAWGEWSTEKVKHDVGYEPNGMKRDANLWKAPLPDYNNGKENQTLFSESVFYILSAITGIGIIASVTWIMLKIYRTK